MRLFKAHFIGVQTGGFQINSREKRGIGQTEGRRYEASKPISLSPASVAAGRIALSGGGWGG